MVAGKAVVAQNSVAKHHNLPTLPRYLDTCPKNDVISFSRKRFCALEVRVKVSENTFSVKRPFG